MSKDSSGSGYKRATSYDVAELAGVSQSAVSRVFKEGSSASKSMRKKVHAAADKLGYRPNAIARGLITQRSNMVAVIISKFTNLYYPEVLVRLSQRFSDFGIRVLLFGLESEHSVDTVLDQVLQYQVDGVLTAALMTPAQLRMVESMNIPVVFYNRTIPEEVVSSVRCDQEEGERWLVDELIRAGHKSFGIVSGPPDSTVATERTRGALQKLKEEGIANVTTVSGDFSYESGRDCFAQLVTELGSAPDAIIAGNDVMAIGCIDEARQNFALRVPEDISVVGFDGVGQASYASYNLTTVRQPVGRMTEAAISMLRERIDNPETPPEKRLFSGMRIRGNSARFLDQ